MTIQCLEVLLYNGQRLFMKPCPLDIFFELGGIRAPFMANTSACWRGYVGTWSLSDGRLNLESLDGHVANGALIEIADKAFRHNIDYEDQSLCRKASLQDVFPDAKGPVFAHWYTGQIHATSATKYLSIKLAAEIKRGVVVNIKLVNAEGNS